MIFHYGRFFICVGKWLFYRCEKHVDIYENDGYPSMITLQTGTYRRKFWRVYRWFSGVHVAPVEDTSNELTRSCKVDGPQKNSDFCRTCKDGSERSGVCNYLDLNCEDHNYSKWKAKYNCTKNEGICGFNRKKGCTLLESCENKVENVSTEEIVHHKINDIKDLFK